MTLRSLLSKLILAAEGDMDAAQRGIVYIDEIDKIQTEWLRLQGHATRRPARPPEDARRFSRHGATCRAAISIRLQPGIPFDTTNVLFICGGAFVGLEDIIAKRLGRGGFGFGQMSENRQVASDGLLRQVKPEDLEAFGLIPEIIGRLPVIAPLDALGVDDLARILQSTKGSLIQQFRKLVRFHGADLMFTDAAVKEIARIALDRGTGARGLRGRWSRRSWKR